LNLKLSVFGLSKTVMRSLLNAVRRGVVIVAIALLAVGCASPFVESLESNPWEVIALDSEAAFNDVAFIGESDHGWVVGTNNTLMETTDGGLTWEARVLNLDADQKITFTSVSFADQEGWVAGRPGILLHTRDGGDSWESVPLSPKLPGAPLMMTALGPDTAEMSTDIGAIYRTEDGGRNWKAMVEGAVGVIRNISRDPSGRYVAVSSRGNFYSTWEPGQREWSPHNRNSSRRLQNMGFDKTGHLWLIARGGQVQFADPEAEFEQDEDVWQEAITPEFATSWGLLDMAYRTENEVWVTGGSANLLCSPDGGQTWYKARSVENVPSNFYRVVFLGENRGFVLGQDGVLLRYKGATSAA
jgi:photosystem II stability/assembly factor-like uncharacterized protein